MADKAYYDEDEATTETRLQEVAILTCEIEDLKIAMANKIALMKRLEEVGCFVDRPAGSHAGVYRVTNIKGQKEARVIHG